MASSFSHTALRLLLSCAKAIEVGDLKSADAFLQNIWILADERPYLYKSRVVKYFADALVRRAYRLHPASSNLTFHVDPASYYHYDSNRINGVIENVIHGALMEKTALMGNRRLHLIDFSIPYYCFQNSVLRTLPTFSGDPPPVRVSYILPPFLKKYVDFSRQMEFLTRDAKGVNVKLEDEFKVVYANSLAEVDECEIDFKRRREDEMVVVYYKFKLDKLVRDAKAMERELVRLKEINPTIVIMLDFYSNHTHSNFLTCFKDSLLYSLKTVDWWWELDLYFDDEYEWECNIEAWEGNNVIRRHPTLTEWQHLFSMAGFSRIPLNHRKAIDLIDKFDRFVKIMGEEEECLILGYKECRMFILSAWKPKVEEEHLNFNSSNDKFGLGFNPYPSPLPPLQPFPEGLALNRVAVIPEIHDILNHLHCEHKFSSALTWASKVNNMNETISDPNKYTFSIQSNSCYLKDFKSHLFMHLCEDKIKQTIIEKAIESKDGYHCEPSITNLDGEDNPYPVDVKKYDIDVVVAICLQNRYTNNDLYVVEFYWPATESKTSKSFAPHIFNDFKHMEKKFVTVKVEGTQKAISNIPTSSNTARHLKIAEETEDVDAVEINGVNVEIFPNGHPEIVKAIKEKPSKATQRKLRSKVWDHFDRFEEDGKQVAKCKHCPKVLTGSSKSGTTHLNNHLKVCPGKKKQNQESQLILPVDTNEGSLRFDKKRSHMDLVKMMIKLQCPLDMAEQETFKNFLKGLQPMFEFQSKDILSYRHRIYDEEKEKHQLYFDKLASKFNLTVSLWKNNSGKTTYCSLTSHFIDDGWELKRKILALKTLEHINDTKALGEIIGSLVLEWNISNKVCSITVDNSFLNDSMVDQIKEICLSDQGSVSSNHWFISFTLLEDGFREMDGILFKLRKSIEYVTETRQGKLKCQEAVDQVKLHGGKYWDDLSFRLESDFDVLDSALRSREIFCKLEQIDENFKLNPTMEEWENAVALQSCLKCFDDIKGSQCLPVSLYFPKLCDIYKKFLQLEKSCHSFVTLMKRKFDHYWSLCNSAFAVASVLDPRLKFKIVELSYRVIYGHVSKMQLNKFHKVLRDVYYKYASEAKSLTTSASVFDDFDCSTIGLGNDSILDSLSKFASASNFNEEAPWKLELELYLDEPLLPMDGAFFDILGWWCDKSQRFPILAKMARDFLAIPISVSTPCSSISAIINNPAYSSLNPESMEALVCSENWLETPKENDGENHEPMQITDKRKRKMDEEDSHPVKNSKPSNLEKAINTEDIAKDSNNNDFSLSFDNWMEPQFSSSESIGEKAEIMKALVCNENRLESSIGKPNHEKNVDVVIEIVNNDPLFDINQSDEVQSSSSESEDEATLKEQGPWCEQDIKAYLLSRFTSKEHKRLDKWQRNELNGKLIGRDKKFKFQGEILAPLLMVPQSDETRKECYINDSVVNAFFELLKKRSDEFSNTYINHYSFDSQIAAQLIKGCRSELEVLNWFKAEKLRGVHKLFLLLCLSSHWVLFYVDIKEKKFSWLDPDPSSLIQSYHFENHVKVLLQWFTSFLLPKLGYSDANKWPFIVRNDIPKQKKLG
ncbi:uncharacterized protein [Gossypium hirsutum]|uniref:Uncharacterized protein isoform X3 n=1 Tax=Gossypium hirsutum TaxID=3635 RepID=A0ABM2ZMD2_GOSHI|nr:uncharacterized protein LOC107927488 isoform X3 [Gossypium hirsutum]